MSLFRKPKSTPRIQVLSKSGPTEPQDTTVPFKTNADRRHHIPKQRHQVTNWREYDAALRQRGSLTVWFTPAAIAAWRAEPRTTRGGQPHYSNLAITTALTLRAVYRLALRQTEGLLGSIIRLLGLDLAVPDHDRVAWSAQAIQCPLTSSLLMRCGQIPGVQVSSCDSTHRQQSPLRSIAVHLCATAVRPRLLVCSGRYPPRPAHEGYSRTLSANPCDRVRRSSADAGRAASAQFRPSRSAPRSNAAVR